MRPVTRLLLGASAAASTLLASFSLDTLKSNITQTNCASDTTAPTKANEPRSPAKVERTILSTEGLDPNTPAQKLGVAQVPIRPGLSLTCAIARIQGRRSHMEDEASVVQLRPNQLSSPVIFTLLDGHGGPHCSTYARTHLPAFVAGNISDIICSDKRGKNNEKNDGDSDGLSGAQHAFRVAFRLFDVAYKEWVDTEREAGREVSLRDGAAVVCGVVDDGYLHIAWAGDSRAVAWIDPSVWTPKTETESEEGPWVYSITKDHKPQNAREFRRIEKVPGGFVRNDRVCGRLAMSRALGDHYYKDTGLTNNAVKITDEKEGETLVICDPDYKRIPIDAVRGVVVASDGLWDVLALSEVMQVLRDYTDPALAADELIRRSQRYAHDNTTILVIYPSVKK